MASLFPDDDQVSLDDENTPDEPVTDAAGQTVTADEDDAPLTASDEAHAKHAAAVALGNPSVAPPPVEAAPRSKRAPRKDAGKPRAPKGAGVGDPIPATLTPVVEVGADPIIGHTETISTANATAIIDHKAGRAFYVESEAAKVSTSITTERPLAPGKVVTADDFPDADGADPHLTKRAKARLKICGKYSGRAAQAARLWPKEPARYFDAVSKIFVDVSNENGFDTDKLTNLVLGLLPKSTVEVILSSGITYL